MRPTHPAAIALVAIACVAGAAGCGGERPGDGAARGNGSPNTPSTRPASSRPVSPRPGDPQPGDPQAGDPQAGDPRDRPTGSPDRPSARSAAPSPSPVRPRGGTYQPRPVPFSRAEPVHGGRALVIEWTSGVEPCYVLDRVDVAYRPGVVMVTLYEGRDPKRPNDPCIEIAVQKKTVVRLSSPLGERKVIDGARA